MLENVLNFIYIKMGFLINVQSYILLLKIMVFFIKNSKKTNFLCRLKEAKKFIEAVFGHKNDFFNLCPSSYKFV